MQVDANEHTSLINLVDYIHFNDEHLLVTAANSGSIKLWKFEYNDNDTKFHCIHSIDDAHTGDVEACNFIKIDDQRLYMISCSYDISCKIWRVELEASRVHTSLIVTLLGHERPVWTHDVFIHKDQNDFNTTTSTISVITGGVDGTLRYHVMDLEELEQQSSLSDHSPTTISNALSVMKGHTKAIRCVKFVRLNSQQKPTTVLSGSYDDSLREWDLQSGSCLRVFPRYHKRTIIQLQQSSSLSSDNLLDRNIVLFTACFDSKVREIDYETGELIHTYTGINPVFALSVTDQFVISGGTHKQFFIYDRFTKQQQSTGMILSNIHKRINSSVVINEQRLVFVHGNTLSALPL